MPVCSVICYKDVIKELVRQRDNYTCQLCGNIYHNGKIISIHHIHHDGDKCFTDLIALCKSCHRKCNWNEIPEEQCMEVLKLRDLLNWKNELKEIVANLIIVPKYKSWRTQSARCDKCINSC